MFDMVLYDTLCYMVDIVIYDTLCFMVDIDIYGTTDIVLVIHYAISYSIMYHRGLYLLFNMVDMVLCYIVCYWGIFRAVEKEDENPLTVHMEITDYLGKGNNSSKSQSLATTLIPLLLLNERT